MKLGSLCTGYGGLDMAIETHWGTTTAWYSEVDPHCSTLLTKRFPGVPNLGDLTAVDWADVEPVDILCAGFPCQPFSTAGKRLGADDDRAIFQHIADAISVLRPRVVVLENVAGLLSTGPGRGGGCDVVATLASLGFDCRWGVVRASDAGAPHRRARWFCIATDPDDIGPERPGGTRPRRERLADDGVATAHAESAERRPEEHAPVGSAVG